ncbi:PREDICTED: TBC1 domain family member 22B [Nicrophorus vespilloides]|uniref:TBC1 domain family member 22B n=1 Tax=Nicrophorus vespilloides TaxID=110193 RepID=A0ABM1N2H5_NICVS|nr:PREDICTED: TBC1 domain family member 22B [Nicrophorus vespilloides]
MEGSRNVDGDKASFWKKNSKTVPGRPSPKKDVKIIGKVKPTTTTSFQEFQASVSDAWELGDDEFCIVPGIEKTRISKRVSESAALNVINSHRNSEGCAESTSMKPDIEWEIMRNRIPGRPQPLRCTNQQDEDCESKLSKFQTLLAGSPSMNDLCELSWSGIPVKIRPVSWRLLLGYLPVNLERRGGVLERKRQEYWNSVKQYYENVTEEYQETYHQIHIDVPRMNPTIPLFQFKTVQQMFERILFIWAIRHPASGYVQGINDLVTPFYVVFLQEMIPDDAPFELFDVNSLRQDQRDIIEADSFWCLSKFLDGIQDNYVFAQLGIQKKVNQLKELIQRVDETLHKHLISHNVDYLQFSFRWLNNLLTRELPLRCTIRLWDTYLAECDTFASFQLYVCAAFLLNWKKQLLNENDFQGLMILLQNLPTREWTGQQIRLLIAEAYKLKVEFADAPNHLQSNQVAS